jgi:hypothetical protein
VAFAAEVGRQEAIQKAIVVNNKEVHSDGPCVELEIALIMPPKASGGKIASCQSCCGN